MLDRLIRLSLEYRLLVLALAGGLLVAGGYELATRPVDIFPDLNQPFVTVMAEAHGLAPEEVETLVTLPVEAALGGAPGVERIRSTSADGLALVRAEFSWDMDIFRARQIVQERMQLAREDLPDWVTTEMAPISSITGEILDLGLVSPSGKTSPMELRTLAEWLIRRRLLAVKGVSQVVVIGGEAKQFQVLADPDRMMIHGITMTGLSRALEESSRNTSGGYLVEGNREMLVRNLGRLSNEAEIRDLVVASGNGRSVRVRDVARVQVGPEFPRGAASIGGKPGVVLVVFKQPGADTLTLTRALEREVVAVKENLPDDVVLSSDLFRQATFLQRGVDNVIDALRDGAVLVLVVLFLFLMNLRASVITLVSLPLSFATTGLLFSLFDLTINTMTLGGLAIAVGELVDDAIVGVENTVRRLNDNPSREGPNWFKCLVEDASIEVRKPIFTGTLVVVLVFLPLFALSGIEGRLFSPMAVAYVVSLLASMLVSMTVTPVLAFYLFRKRALQDRTSRSQKTAPILAWLRTGSGWIIAWALEKRRWILAGTLVLLVAGTLFASRLGSQFLPEFDEGTVLVMVQLPPGTSLKESDRIAGRAESLLHGMDGVAKIGRYTGRGEHDEHAAPVTISHILISMDQNHDISRQEILAEVRRRLSPLDGINLSVGQPLAHRIDHLMTGIQAQVVVKVFGPDLDVLRNSARQISGAMGSVPGVTDLFVEPLVQVPQVHIQLYKQRLTEVGLSPGQLVEELEVAVGGHSVGQILEGERSFDLFLRLDRSDRDSIAKLRSLPVRLSGGSWARLSDLARVYEGRGPNRVKRDNQTRRLAISCNTQGRSVGEVVADIDLALEPVRAELPRDTSIRLEGQFEAKEKAVRLILMLSLFSLAAMFLILYGQFRSINLASQVLLCIPVAFLGGVLFLLVTGQDFSVAALVGFVSLAGIATRNGILLIAHYLQLLRESKGPLTMDLLVLAGQERAAPVIMTALTTGVGLLPLLLSAGETGREILYPVATVVIGGLITSTIFEFLLRPALFWSMGRTAAEDVVSIDRTC